MSLHICEVSNELALILKAAQRTDLSMVLLVLFSVSLCLADMDHVGHVFSPSLTICLLIGLFYPSAFNIILDVTVLTSAILMFLLYVPFFVFLYFSFNFYFA